MSWDRGDLLRVTGESSSVISQWLGKGNGPTIHTIGRVSSALKLSAASGYSALWLACGEGPKMASDHSPSWPLRLIKPSQWNDLDDWERGIIDHAAHQAMQSVLAARPSRKQPANASQ